MDMSANCDPFRLYDARNIAWIYFQAIKKNARLYQSHWKNSLHRGDTTISLKNWIKEAVEKICFLLKIKYLSAIVLHRRWKAFVLISGLILCQIRSRFSVKVDNSLVKYCFCFNLISDLSSTRRFRNVAQWCLEEDFPCLLSKSLLLSYSFWNFIVNPLSAIGQPNLKMIAS